MLKGYRKAIAFFKSIDSAEEFNRKLKIKYSQEDVNNIHHYEAEKALITATKPVAAGEIIVQMTIREELDNEIQKLVIECHGRNALSGQLATFGSWEDARSPEEIINDIYTNRNQPAIQAQA